jgi:1,4-dihydroxy-2-naphthoate octaprenyltransferase
VAAQKKPSALSLWVEGARPKTLPLAVSPVLLGVASAQWADSFSWLLSALALVVSLSIQIGVNYANDYSDGIRGTDQFRVGPARLTGSGAMPARNVLLAALLSFALAGLSGLVIVIMTGLWWLLAVGVAALIAAWFYTGGKTPYGYRGLGELVVFVFFGLVATIGTAAIQVGSILAETWLTGSGVGFIASAVLLVNNLRDLSQDAEAGKRTLAVKVGARGTRVIITVLLMAPFVVVALLAQVFLLAPYVFFVLFLVIPTVVIVWSGTRPRDLIVALQLMSVTSVVYALGLSAAIVF